MTLHLVFAWPALLSYVDFICLNCMLLGKSERFTEEK